MLIDSIIQQENCSAI